VLQNIEQDKKEIKYFWQSNSVEALCPFCEMLSARSSKDYYTKPIQDIPSNNKAVYHVVRFKKYFCENPNVIIRNSLSVLENFLKRMQGKQFDLKSTA